MSYRNRLYPSYTSVYTPAAVTVDEIALRKSAKAILARMSDWLPVDTSTPILDVACGAGGLLYALRRAGYENLRGVDCSAQQVSVAKQICPAVEMGDAIAFLKKNRESFGLITAFDIIEHFNKSEVFDFLDAVYDALTPNGHLIIQTPNADNPMACSLRYGDFTHEVAFTAESLRRVVSVAGFEEFEARECRPFAHGFVSSARVLLWHLIRAIRIGKTLIETGDKGSNVLTRVFLARVIKLP